MDFSKIRLNNERNEHVTKRLNRLNTWQFFKVLYRENVMRLFGFSVLMILFVAPIIVVMMWGSMQNSNVSAVLPTLNGFGFSTGVWEGMAEYYASQAAHNNLITGLLCVAASLLCSLVLSGGFAVIRDAFWTGKLSTVGVFKSLGKGIKANILYAVITDIILAFSVFGAYEFYVWAVTVMPLWLSIVLLVLICIVIVFIAIYLFTLCSVSNVYKQSVYENLDDAWRLMWLNILPNIVHFLLMLVPIALYFVMANTQFVTIYMVLLLMFGGMYVPLVWQTHMMKTFALFHPVEVKKKKHQHLKAEAVDEQPSEPEQGRKGKKARKADAAEAPESVADESFNDEDIYATEDGIEDIADVADEQIADVVDEQSEAKDE